MATVAKKIEWCTVRLGEDMNWWVVEVSDDIHWDVDGLSIIDPRQIAHILDLVEPLGEYKFDPDLFETAFIPFQVQKNLGDGLIRLVRSKERFSDSEETLFGLPNVIDEENSSYADFLNHITKVRVKMLNDVIDFEKDLTIDEVEETISEEENNSLIEGKAVHLFTEVTSILDYVPAGWELDGEENNSPDEDKLEDIPEVEEEDTSEIAKDKSLKWDEESEDKGEKVEDEYEGGPPDENQDEGKDSD